MTQVRPKRSSETWIGGQVESLDYPDRGVLDYSRIETR
jgi:hypothetical protein